MSVRYSQICRSCIPIFYEFEVVTTNSITEFFSHANCCPPTGVLCIRIVPYYTEATEIQDHDITNLIQYVYTSFINTLSN